MVKQTNEMDPYEVFEGSAWEAGLLKSILEDNNIEARLTQMMMLPWNTISTTGASAKVFVALCDYEQAKAIVSEFCSNMEQENSNEPPE